MMHAAQGNRAGLRRNADSVVEALFANTAKCLGSVGAQADLRPAVMRWLATSIGPTRLRALQALRRLRHRKLWQL